jgi:hypothetical protein
MIFLIGILVIPLFVALAGFLFTDRVSWKELLIQIGAQILIAGVCGGVAYYSNVTDTEVWTGTVTKKSRDWTARGCGTAALKRKLICSPQTRKN